MAYGSRQWAVISYVSNTCILPKDGERVGIDFQRAISEDRLDKVLKLLRILRFPICAVMHAVTTPMRNWSPLIFLLA